MINLQEADYTLGKLAVKFPQLIPLFETLNLDYACSGDSSLVKACEMVNLDVSEVLDKVHARLEQETPSQVESMEDVHMNQLIDHILDRYHEVGRQSLAVIADSLEKVIQKGLSIPPELIDKLRWVFRDLELHMQKEEQILFPYIRSMATGEAPPSACFQTPEGPMRVMEMEHQDAALVMGDIRKICHGFQMSGNKDLDLAILMKELEKFHFDLRTHMHLENNLLFPAVRDMLA